MKVYSRSKGLSPLIFISALDGCQWLNARPSQFLTGRGPRCSFNRRLGGPTFTKCTFYCI